VERGDSAVAVENVISGATSTAYKLAADDQGKYITVTVTRAGYSGAKVSAAVGPVTTGDGDSDTLTPDIDSALIGTWRDKPSYGDTFGAILTATFTDSSVTWGGSAGDILNQTVATYQGYGSFAWEVKNGNINMTYIDPTLGKQSYPCYTYTINGDGELELGIPNMPSTPFATLVKD
jgi:hypothetical protein